MFLRKDTSEGAVYQKNMYELNCFFKNTHLKYLYGCEVMSRDKLYKLSSEVVR
jgi:hypothetical protein